MDRRVIWRTLLSHPYPVWIVENSESCVTADTVLLMTLFLISVCRLKKTLTLPLRCPARATSLIQAPVFRKKASSSDTVWWSVRGSCRGADFWWLHRRRESVCEVNHWLPVYSPVSERGERDTQTTAGGHWPTPGRLGSAEVQLPAVPACFHRENKFCDSFFIKRETLV